MFPKFLLGDNLEADVKLSVVDNWSCIVADKIESYFQWFYAVGMNAL
jgi:hypothetical protein